MHQVLRLAVVVGFVISALPYQVGTAQDYHVCGNHSTGWHSHEGDGYVFAWWKIEFWRPNVLWDINETTVTDDWAELIQRLKTKNESCSPETVSVQRDVSFTHKVDITWGAEITGSVEGLVQLWFTDIQANVGAKVTWNRTGSDTKVESFSIKHEKQLAPCRYIEFFYEVRKVHKEYSAKFARSEFWCRDHSTNDKGPNFLCDVRMVYGEGQGYIRQRTGWENEQKICDCDSAGNVSNVSEFNDQGEPINNGGGNPPSNGN